MSLHLEQTTSGLVVSEGDGEASCLTGVAILQDPEDGGLSFLLVVSLLVSLQAKHEEGPEANGSGTLEVTDGYPTTFLMGLALWGAWRRS